MPSPQLKTPSKSQILLLIKDTADRDEGYHNWVSLLAVMCDKGVGSPASLIGAAATIAVETAYTFMPVSEYGDAEHFKKFYGTRSDYVLDAGGLWKWRGRGLIQLTGQDNYTHCGKDTGLDLRNHPELACTMPQSARCFEWFWKTHGIDKLCDARKWEAVRRTVNGGTNGLTAFMRIVNLLSV